MSKNWQTYSAITAALAAGADDLLLRDKSDTTDHATEGTVGRIAWEGLLGLAGVTPGGRLTLESGVPISTTDQTAKGTLYYTPYAHDFVRLYNGTRPTLYTFTERSLALTLTSGKNYDVFLYDNSGTLTLELSAAWTNDTTRADALAWQAGVGWVKSGTATRLWLGTIRASGTNTTESSWVTTGAPAKSFVWNAYNQILRSALVHDSTDSWTYTTGTWRQANGSANNEFQFVCGLPTPWVGRYGVLGTNSVSAALYNAIGFDSTSGLTGSPGRIASVSGRVSVTMMHAEASGVATTGYHYVAALERSDATGTSTWYGDGGDATLVKMGLMATVLT